MGNKLGQDEKVQVYAAIAHVISAMPMAAAAGQLSDLMRFVFQSKFTMTVEELSGAVLSEMNDLCIHYRLLLLSARCEACSRVP